MDRLRFCVLGKITTEMMLYPSQGIMMWMQFIIGEIHLDHLAEVVSVGLCHSNFFLGNWYISQRHTLRLGNTLFLLKHSQPILASINWPGLQQLRYCLPGGDFYFLFLPYLLVGMFCKEKILFPPFIHSTIYINKDSWKFTEWNPTLLLSCGSNCSSSVHGELLHVGSSVFLTCAHSFSSTSSTFLFSDTTGHSMLILYFSKVDSVPSIGEWCLESKI